MRVILFIFGRVFGMLVVLLWILSVVVCVFGFVVLVLIGTLVLVRVLVMGLIGMVIGGIMFLLFLRKQGLILFTRSSRTFIPVALG